MKLIYLYHSGFALLGDDFTLIFDYWKDSESDGDGICLLYTSDAADE